MFDIGKVETIVGEEVSLSTTMQLAMQRWLNEYIDNPPWLSDTVPTLGIPSGIAEELARISMLEFEFIGAGNSERAKFITKCMLKALEDVADNLEMALAIGGTIPKPYITADNLIGVEWISQDRVFPISDEAGELTGAVFPSQKINNGTVYTRFEIHTLKNRVYTIQNYAYSSKNTSNPLEKSVPVNLVPGWENIEPVLSWERVDYPAYAVFKVPGKNKTDLSSPLGESVFARVESLIRDADVQYGRFLWEFEATEVAVHADGEAFRSTVDKDGKVTNSIPVGKERLYRLVQGVGKIGGGGFFENYAPTIRDVSQINGLNQILMMIENKVGLVQGTLSNERLSETYSNELSLKLKRNTTENVSNRIQTSFAETMKDLCMAMNTLCDLYGLVPGASITPEDVQMKFGDSIVTDDVSRLEQMRQDVNDGIIPKWMYIAEKYGKTEQEAKEIASQGVDTSSAPETGLF